MTTSRRTWPAGAARSVRTIGPPARIRCGQSADLRGEHADTYLQREAGQRGYAVVVRRGRHVAEPTELTEPELTAYWRELLTVARALAAHYAPAQISPGRPLDWRDHWRLPGEQFEADAQALRALLSRP